MASQELKILTFSELFTGPLARNGRWTVGCIEGQIGWPYVTTEVEFRSRKLYLLPYTRDKDRDLATFPAVALMMEGDERDADGYRLISHFLSTLAWVRKAGVSVEYWTGGNLPRPMGGCKNRPMAIDHYYEPYFPDPQDKRTRLALALYREGLTINHVAYRCLSFFKILNILFRSGAEQIAWIDASLPKVPPGTSSIRAQQISESEPSVGRHLYTSNRCAIAHANGDPVADPEDPDDIRRLHADLPLIRSLAEIAIECEFGVKSGQTVYREHLYELEGFKPLFTPMQVAALTAGGALKPNEYPTIPDLNIRLALREPYRTLESMRSTIISSTPGQVMIRCQSQSGHIAAHLELNFRDERLIFSGTGLRDDGSVVAMTHAISATKFELDYMLNGILEVRASEDGRLLGRCDAFIPTNIDFNRSVKNFEDKIRDMQSDLVARGLHQI